MQQPIQFINESTVASDDQIKAIVAALQVQVSRDFAPIWGTDAALSFISKGEKPDPAQWWMVVMDTSDQSGALGYHDVTSADLPIGKVFAKDDIQYGSSLSVTMSHELCLTGDTKVSLLNGTEVPIEDLVGVGSFYVYSCNENGELRPGRAHSARLTKKNAPIVQVTLDNGHSIRCTPDHPFMMRDGSYKAAGTMCSGDSLMPLYRRVEVLDPTKKRKGVTNYEQVYDPRSEKWIYTHRMVVPYCSAGYVRHHKDFNRFNNSPDNIEVMKWADHSELHANHIRHYANSNKGKKRNLSPEQRKRLAEAGRERLLRYNGSPEQIKALAEYQANPEVKRQIAERLSPWARSKENRDRVANLAKSSKVKAINSRRITEYNKSPEHREIARDLGRKAMAALHANPIILEKMNVARNRTCHTRWHVNRGIVNPDCALCCPPQEAYLQSSCAIANHKVLSVEQAGTSDVYDLTVDKYHNFATTVGIFVHNCEMLGDPFITGAKTNSAGTLLYAEENCDAVEDDSLGYQINGVLVSDFVTPAWFVDAPGQSKATKYDFQGHCSAPFEVLRGGYISYLDLTKPEKGWQEITRDGKDVAARKPYGSRFERRRRFRQHSYKPKRSAPKRSEIYELV